MTGGGAEGAAEFATGPRALLEICVDSLESALAARDGGADRLEVCAALPVGGLTPSAGLFAAVRAAVDLPLHVLIRPRAGDFCSTDAELDVMQRDIAVAKTAGAQGVVLGALTEGPRPAVDAERTARLLEVARPLALTFHRAFDFTADPLAALEVIASLGIERVLTSGGHPSVPEGLEVLAQLVDAAGERVIVMPGGGVRSADVARILRATGARELHASASHAVMTREGANESAPSDDRTAIRLGSTDEDGVRTFTDEAEVRRMVAALALPRA